MCKCLLLPSRQLANIFDLISIPKMYLLKKTLMMNISKFDVSCLPTLVSFYLPLLALISISFLYPYLMKQKKKALTSKNLPPSPPKLPIIGNLHLLGKLPHQTLWQLAQNTGPVMLLKFGSKYTLKISSATMAKEILKTHDLNFCTRPNSSGAKRLAYNFLDVAFTPYNDHWKEMRKLLVTELLSSKRAPQFQKSREKEINGLINFLSSRSGSPVYLDEEFYCMVDEIVCQVAFGKSHRGEKFNGKELKEVIGDAMMILDSFSAGDFFPWIIGWIVDLISGERKRLEKCFKQLDGYFQMVLDEHLDKARLKLGHDEQDVADSMIRRLAKGETIGNLRLTKNHIKASFLNIFLGGVDTSSVTMAWAMSELIKNPRVMQKLQTEIRQLVPSKSKVQEADLPNLTYLKMVVKETLRLHAPVPFLIPHESICHSKIGGFDIFPNTRVLVNVWGIGRDPNSWNNPNKFFPERFEDNNIDFRGQNFELIPFGAGRRFCPGVNTGILTIELTLANLLHSFDWEVPSGMKIEDISMEEKGGIVLRRKIPLCLVPIKVN